MQKFEEFDEFYFYLEYFKKFFVNLVYLNYLWGKYIEMVIVVNWFVMLYFGDFDLVYMFYFVGQSFFKQMLDIIWDQVVIECVVGVFKELIQCYLDFEYIVDVEQKLIIVQDQLVGKEMQIGWFYLNKCNYIVGINWFKIVVINYQMICYVEEVLFCVMEVYYVFGVVLEVQIVVVVLGYNFFDI